MTILNPLEQAFLAAAERRADPAATQAESGPVLDVPQNATISVEDGDGHMLDGSVISWDTVGNG